MSTIRNFFPKNDYSIISRVIKRSSEAPNPQEIDKISYFLDKLPNILGPENWYLSGGLAILVSSNDWYRRPGNINISIHEDDLFNIVDNAMRSKNYHLLSRGLQVRPMPGTKWESYEVPSWNDINLSKDYKKLRLVRFKKDKPVPNIEFLDFIDVHVYRKVSHRFKCYPQFNRDDARSIDPKETSLYIPYNLTLQNSEYKTLSGKTIHVRSLPYLEIIKKWLINQPKRDPEKLIIDNLDLSKVQAFLRKESTSNCK